jgi:hypothetical protein
VAALDEEPIDLTTHQLHQCEWARWSNGGFTGKTPPGLRVERIEDRTGGSADCEDRW